MYKREADLIEELGKEKAAEVLKKESDDINRRKNDMVKDIEKMGATQADSIKEEHDQNKLERQMINIDIAQLKLQQEALEKQLKRLEEKSNIIGTVLEINENAVQTANQMPASPLIRIASTDEFIVKGVLSEFDALEIKEGQSVKLTANSVLDQEWQGEVIRVAYMPESNQDGIGPEMVQYPVEVKVSSNHLNLKPGFTMNMEIETESHYADVLPIEAVQQVNDEHFVYVVENGVAVRRVVEVGMTSFEQIEIIGGITTEDVIILQPLGQIRDGVEVIVP